MLTAFVVLDSRCDAVAWRAAADDEVPYLLTDPWEAERVVMPLESLTEGVDYLTDPMTLTGMRCYVDPAAPCTDPRLNCVFLLPASSCVYCKAANPATSTTGWCVAANYLNTCAAGTQAQCGRKEYSNCIPLPDGSTTCLTIPGPGTGQCFLWRCAGTGGGN